MRSVVIETGEGQNSLAFRDVEDPLVGPDDLLVEVHAAALNRADLRRAGFTWRPGKGDHQIWEHPAVPTVEVSLDGQTGDDAKRYQETDVRNALRAVERAKGERS